LKAIPFRIFFCIIPKNYRFNCRVTTKATDFTGIKGPMVRQNPRTLPELGPHVKAEPSTRPNLIKPAADK